jgi:uncharacterized protein (TIGR00299 family) protein
MPRILYFDCFSGISGDMALGALLDAGLALDALRAELAKLGVAGWSVEAERGMRAFLSGTRALVHAPEQEAHRHLSDVRAIIEASGLAPLIKARSLKVFGLLAEAEGRVHGIAPEQIHFHEVGALDAIIDVVGVVAGLALLGIDEVYASPVPLGSGWVRAAHGMLPIPAPATLALLAQAGAPTTIDSWPAELVTPTGAALLAGLATFARPPMQLEFVGYGLGGRDPQERPNALRVWIGSTGDRQMRASTGQRRTENGHARHVYAHTGDHSHAVVNDAERPQGSPAPATGGEPEPAGQQLAAAGHPPAPILLETNIDDQPAEQLAYAAERLLAHGALDVWMAPIQMKKGRPGVLLAALVPAELEAASIELLMRETTTLGVRRRPVERHVAERELALVDTIYGQVRVKRKLWGALELGAAPEYEDCARIAREHGLAIREVYRLALEAAD